MCYGDKCIRLKYPLDPVNKNGTTSKWDFVALETQDRKLPPKPTDAPPGSLEKVLVMAERYISGYHIYHPLDAKRNIK